MNNKQKLSYMVLGAVILAVGIGYGAVRFSADDCTTEWGV